VRARTTGTRQPPKPPARQLVASHLYPVDVGAGMVSLVSLGVGARVTAA
jgi:hypothetical protein